MKPIWPWPEEKLKSFEQKYKDVVNNKGTSFEFEGRRWGTEEAELLIEFINKLNKRPVNSEELLAALSNYNDAQFKKLNQKAKDR